MPIESGSYANMTMPFLVRDFSKEALYELASRCLYYRYVEFPVDVEIECNESTSNIDPPSNS